MRGADCVPRIFTKEKMGLTKPQPIHDCTKAAPTKQTINASGVVVIEKLPQNRNRRLFLKPCGATVWVILSTNPAIRRSTEYGAQIQADKIKKGFLPWDECPILKGHLRAPAFKPTAACEGVDGRGKLESPCPCLVGIKKKRVEAHLKLEREYAKKMQSSDSVMRDFVQHKMVEEISKPKAEKIGRKPKSFS